MKVKINTAALVSVIINVLLIGLITAQYFQMLSFKDSFNMVGVRFGEKVINNSDLESLLENEESFSNIKYALWNEDKSKEVTAEQTGGNIRADVVTIAGDFFAMPLSLKNGMGFSDDDYEGCVLDKESAWELWKSYDVIGNTIVIDENIYYVRGIAEKIDDTRVIYIRDRNKETLYAYADFKYTNIKNSTVIDDYEQKTKEILKSLGSYEGAIIDGVGLNSLLSTTGTFAIIIAIVLICIFNCKSIYDCIYVKCTNYKNKALAIIFIIGVIIGTIAAAYIVSSGLILSVKYIPDKWSDFEFIKNSFNNLLESFENIRNISYIKYDSIMMERFKSGLYFNLIVFTTEFIYSQIYIWYISNRRHKV